MSLLKITDLEVSYGAINAVRKISFSVEAGEVVTLIGSNGAGKTTTLRALTGLAGISGGSVTFDGEEMRGLKPHEIVARGVAHSPEGRRVFGRMSVKENLDMGAFSRKDQSGLKTDRDRVYELFPILAERAKQAAGTLSGGEQQMLAIGRALMARPRLLLLDEPSLGVAPLATERIYERLAEINEQGTTMLLVEQNANMALSLATRGYVLETGEIHISGSCDQLRDDERVRKAYLGED